MPVPGGKPLTLKTSPLRADPVLVKVRARPNRSLPRYLARRNGAALHGILLAAAFLALVRLPRDGAPALPAGSRAPSSEVVGTVCSNYLLLPSAQVEELLKNLEGSGGEPDAIRQFTEVLAEISSNRRVVGLDGWIRFAVVNGKKGPDILNTFEELLEARRQLDLLRGNEVIEVGADDSQADVPGKKSFDLLIRSEPGGAIVRAIEVTTVQDDVTRAQDIRSAVQHGADKSRGDPRAATAETREVSVAMRLGCYKPKGAVSAECPRPGLIRITFPPGADGTLNIVSYDLLADSIPVYLNGFKGMGALPLDTVTLVDRDTQTVLAVYHQQRLSNGETKWVRAL